jgi:hypothetical protein
VGAVETKTKPLVELLEQIDRERSDVIEFFEQRSRELFGLTLHLCTALHALAPGVAVNLEIDLIARYVERMLGDALLPKATP